MSGCRTPDTSAVVPAHSAKATAHRSCASTWTIWLFDGVTERLCVVPNPNVPGHDHDQRRRLTKQFRCCQMHRVKRSNRFDRKRSPDAGQDRVGHGNEKAAPLESSERPHGSALFFGRQLRSRSSAQNRSRAFGDRQRGRDRASSRAYRFQRVDVALQQRRDQSARFNVSKADGGGVRNRRPDATPRHDRRRSTRRRFRREDECPATPLWGHRLRAGAGSRRTRRARRSGLGRRRSLNLAGRALRRRDHAP